MTKFNQSKFKSKAKKLVVKYLNYQINEKDVFDEKEVFILWSSKVGVNAKAVLSSDWDYHYFEVTYLIEEGVYIVDVYRYVGRDEFHEDEDDKAQ